MKFDEQRIRLKLKQAGIRFRRPLSEKAVERFEERHDVRLPADFRWFVTTVGNGGDGPTHGWRPFSPASGDYDGPPKWGQEWRNTNLLSDEEWDAVDDAGTIFLHDHGCGMYDFLVVTGPEAGTVWFSDSICRVSPELSPSQTQEVIPAGTPDSEAEKILQAADFPQRLSFLEHYESWVDRRVYGRMDRWITEGAKR